MKTTLQQTSSYSSPVFQEYQEAEGTTGQVRLRLGAELRLEQAAELSTGLIQAFEKTDYLVLDVGAVEAVDLSFVQLICAAHRLAAESGKRLAWAGPMPSPVIQLLTTAGITCSPGCIGQHERCLWPERSQNEKDSAYGR